MELIVLGRHGRYPAKGGANSSYIIRNHDTVILLDMGSGAISRMANYIELNDIDAVIFSHLHGDHMSDFLPLNYMVGYKMARGERNEKISVFLPKSPNEEFSFVTNGKDKEFSFIVEEDKKSVDVGSLHITFLKVLHPVECYAVKITDGKKTFLYTGDTTDFNGLSDYFKGVDLVLGDACILDKNWNEKCPHISVKTLSTYAKENNVKLLLTHLPEYDSEIKEIEREAKSVFSNVELAEEMKIYTI